MRRRIGLMEIGMPAPRCIALGIAASILAMVGPAYSQPFVTRIEPRYAVDVPKGWTGDAVESTLYVKLRLTQITARPADAGVDLNTAAREMLTYYSQRNVTLGPTQRLRFPEGEALWIEALDTPRPYSAAVARGGTVFLVRAQVIRENPAPGLREALFDTVRTIRPVSVQDLKLSPAFAVAAKTFLDLIALRAARRTIDDPDVPTGTYVDAQSKARESRSTVGDTLLMRLVERLAENVEERRFEAMVKDAMRGEKSLTVAPDEARWRTTCRQEIERILKAGATVSTGACG